MFIGKWEFSRIFTVLRIIEVDSAAFLIDILRQSAVLPGIKPLKVKGKKNV